jgi:hypothetical protein
MGGLLIDIPLASVKKRSSAALANDFSSWVSSQLADLSRADKTFAPAIAEFPGIDPARLETVGRDTAIIVPLSDCGGAGYVTMLATAHVIERLVTKRASSLAKLLAKHGAKLAPRERQREDGTGVLIDWRGRIGNLVDEWFDFSSGEQVTRHDLGLEVDPVKEGDPYSIPVTKLPAAQRKRLQAAWADKACGCPLCSQP